MRHYPVYHILFTAVLVLLLSVTAKAQRIDDTTGVVQLSGLLLTEENGVLEPLPYVNIFVRGTQRGTFSSFDGFFSIVARVGETVIFSSIGYKEVEYMIPDTLPGNRYSIIQVLDRDTVWLPETVIYPWPSREHFKLEFLAMETQTPLEARLAENLSDRAIAQLILYLPSDGNENTDLFLKQQAQSYYYEGQFKPINVLNAFAWADFVRAIKRGDYKKKN